MKTMRTALLILLLCAPLLLISCGDSGQHTSQGNLLVTSTGQYGALQVSLTTSSVNNLGDVVPITVSVRNVGDSTVSLTYGAETSVDVQVKQGDTVWQWSFANVFAGLEMASQMAPGASMTFSRDWNQKDNEGNRVSGGSYTVIAWFEADSVDGVKPQTKLATEPITITVLR